MSIPDRRLDALERRINERVTAAQTLVQPEHVMDFASNPKFLGKELYPAQGTALKVLTLATELFTPYDFEVISDWCAGYQLEVDGDAARWVGTEGTPGDLLERIEWCRARDQRWFREALLILGRRGSKGYLTAIMAAWVIWGLLSMGDPQAHYGLDSNKRLRLIVFAGTKAQAVANQFRGLSPSWLRPRLASSDSTRTSRHPRWCCSRRRSSRPASIRPTRTTPSSKSGRGKPPASRRGDRRCRC